MHAEGDNLKHWKRGSAKFLELCRPSALPLPRRPGLRRAGWYQNAAACPWAFVVHMRAQLLRNRHMSAFARTSCSNHWFKQTKLLLRYLDLNIPETNHERRLARGSTSEEDECRCVSARRCASRIAHLFYNLCAAGVLHIRHQLPSASARTLPL